MASSSNWNPSISFSREEEEVVPSSTIACPSGTVEVAGQEKVFLMELDDQRVEDRRELGNLEEKRLCEPNDGRLFK